MDELAEVAGLLTADHPSSAQAIEKSRRRLMNEAARRHRWHPRRSSEPAGKATSRRTALVAGLSAVMMVAAAWGVHAWMTRPLYHPEPLAGQSGPAASFLLAAADGRARHASSGRHWYLHTLNGTTAVVRSPTRPNVRYTVEVRASVFNLAQNGASSGAKMYEWDGDDVEVRPVSPADHAAWTADWQPDADALKVEPPHGQRGPEPEEGGYFDIGPPEARELPSDPSELRAWILNYATKFDHERLRQPDLYLFIYAPLLLAELPVSDRVRIATYRILASLKGVRMVDATDATGRKGRAVSMVQTTPAYGTIDWQLFIDPSTGRLTASQGVVVKGGSKNAGVPPGSRQFFQIVKKADWTNESSRKLLPGWIWNKNWEPPFD
ncbi:hypothetical protein SMC26_26175 [Actinomadura fulvescens]|uniref:Uncharacterized protein n=1 Tax=Actinomadura fulvescens TaxID=46160 RepID=A0ABP6CL51_9ACTN